MSNDLGINSSDTQRECLLLIDGLGKNAVDEFGNERSFMRELSYVRTLKATFPSTTATSLTSLGTGLAPGKHGMVGYTMRVPYSGTPERILNALKWDERVDPLIWQPSPTLFERANAQEIRTSHVAGKRYAESGFTRAALRGGIYRGANTNEEIVEAAATALELPSSFAYLYLNDVDEASHNQGFGSERFKNALERVDQLIHLLIKTLPKGTRLWVTSDHGMINRGDYIVVGKENSLLEGVDLMAGEPRVRYLYLKPDEIDSVRTRWHEYLGDRVDIYTRDEAILRGFFGGEVSASFSERIGDLIVIARDNLILVEKEREAQQLAMVGHHGGVTKAEVEIPLLSYEI